MFSSITSASITSCIAVLNLHRFYCTQVTKSDQPVYQFVNSPYIIHTKQVFGIENKQMITHSNVPKMKNKILSTCLQGDLKPGSH